MFHFTFRVQGKKVMDRALKGIIAVLTDMRPILEKIADDFYIMMQRRFESEGAYESMPMWEPLSPGYKLTKDYFFPGEKILVREGDLRDSITKRDAKGSVCIIDKDGLQIGSSLTVGDGKYNLLRLMSEGFYRPPVYPVKAKALAFYIGPQKVFAQSVKGVDVPARPVVMISAATKFRWSKIIHEELYNRLKPNWQTVQQASYRKDPPESAQDEYVVQ